LLKSIPDFSLTKDREPYREAVGGWKDIESDFYSNGSPNDYSNNKFKKDSWRCTNAHSRKKQIELSISQNISHCMNRKHFGLFVGVGKGI